MRELKFRLWDLTKKEMYWTDFRWGQSGRSGAGWIKCAPIGKDVREAHLLIDPNECEIMQFTDLYDSNKVPIYEGDLIKNKHFSDVRPHPVEFYNGCFMWLDSPLGYDFDSEDWANSPLGTAKWAVVVGNIYQNPQ